MKSTAERQKDYRDERRKQGLVLKQIWVDPKLWPRIRKYLGKVK